MDPDLMPLMVAENYINSKEAVEMKKLSEAATSIAEGDILSDLVSIELHWKSRQMKCSGRFVVNKLGI